jgi:hypothetical protein
MKVLVEVECHRLPAPEGRSLALLMEDIAERLMTPQLSPISDGLPWVRGWAVTSRTRRALTFVGGEGRVAASEVGIVPPPAVPGDGYCQDEPERDDGEDVLPAIGSPEWQAAHEAALERRREAEQERRRAAGEPSCGCGGYGDHDETHEDNDDYIASFRQGREEQETVVTLDGVPYRIVGPGRPQPGSRILTVMPDGTVTAQPSSSPEAEPARRLLEQIDVMIGELKRQGLLG